MQVRGQGDPQARMPARAIEDEDELALGASSTCFANWAKETLKSSWLTVVQRCHWVRPLAGWMNPAR